MSMVCESDQCRKLWYYNTNEGTLMRKPDRRVELEGWTVSKKSDTNKVKACFDLREQIFMMHDAVTCKSYAVCRVCRDEGVANADSDMISAVRFFRAEAQNNAYYEKAATCAAAAGCHPPLHVSVEGDKCIAKMVRMQNDINEQLSQLPSKQEMVKQIAFALQFPQVSLPYIDCDQPGLHFGTPPSVDISDPHARAKQLQEHVVMMRILKGLNTGLNARGNVATSGKPQPPVICSVRSEMDHIKDLSNAMTVDNAKQSKLYHSLSAKIEKLRQYVPALAEAYFSKSATEQDKSDIMDKYRELKLKQRQLERANDILTMRVGSIMEYGTFQPNWLSDFEMTDKFITESMRSGVEDDCKALLKVVNQQATRGKGKRSAEEQERLSDEVKRLCVENKKLSDDAATAKNTLLKVHSELKKLHKCLSSSSARELQRILCTHF